MTARFRTMTKHLPDGVRVRFYRGIAIPDTCRNTWEEYLWMRGVDAAYQRGLWRMRASTLKAWLRSGELINVAFTLRGRWMRVALLVGSAPGSNMGLWRTQLDTLHGWNYRVGSLRRCVTILAHTRKEARDDRA